MRYRKYLVVIALAWILILTWTAYLVLENRRMATAGEEQTASLVARGLDIYANNCVVCHGPMGEGVVGPPLNREEFRGDPEEATDAYDLIYRTVSQGRPGSTETHWVRLATGEWASFTSMPTWSQDFGGPLNEQEVRAVATFIMLGDWTQVNGRIPAPRLQGELPDAGVAPEVNQQAKAIIQAKGCLACHTIGQVGGFVGPDLTKVGTWGLDADFLKTWISDPPAMKDRAPVYWSNYGGPLLTPQGMQALQSQPGAGTAQARGEAGGGAPGGGSQAVKDLPLNPPVPLGPTQMPKLLFTDDELDVLVQYLLGLK
ncbi:c-type cytochrome [Limnochorda pilosa]|uniref:Cytochrome c domain-containing protein n=1 Tax=Limnochorda pilosa TaxID=1555112 RepID=A0A0K2SJS2_LIMPI|nr:c-type cytochrome [Limnochorda pilosa]BAS27361.1 hypothetical protein LIP_1513 [Limnochorda pilosa]